MSASIAQFTFEFLDIDYEVSVLEYSAVEKVSFLSGVNLTLVSEKMIPSEEAVRQEGVLTIINPAGTGNPDRYFHGIIRMFRHNGTKGRFHLYEAQLVPSLWLLTLKQNCRIFQDMKLQDIVGKILQESGITQDLYQFRLAHEDIFNKFSMQYNETDLDFISRLLEKEGIFYFFEHHKDRHVLVFCDTDAYYQDIQGDTSIPFNAGGMASADKTSISSFDYSDRLKPDVFTHTNYNFKTPSSNLKTDHKAEYNNPDFPLEIYSYPGSYGETGRGGRLARINLEAIAALKEKGRGASNCVLLTPGALFQLTGHYNKAFNKEYLLIEVSHGGRQPGALKELAPDDATPGYGNRFMVIPSSVIYRPEQLHPKPMVPGQLSAVVTGPEGYEIYPDEYGRVHVQFHFDREGKKDEQSSCWIRTMQFWNGGGYGSQFIPRVGDEVMVSFVNGDMDYPIITGCAINEAKRPNYSLPANKTQSGIRTRSTPGGTANNFNELRFEDKIGKEEVYLQGEKDWNILIKNDKGQRVGHDETLHVGNDRTKFVTMNQSETIGVNKKIHVGVNHNEIIGSNETRSIGGIKTENIEINYMENVGAAKGTSIGGLYQIAVSGVMNETVACAKTEEVGLEKLVVVGKDMDEDVMGNRTSKVGGDLTRNVTGKHYIKTDEEFVMDSTTKITFKSGSSRIKIDGSTITMRAARVNIIKPEGSSSDTCTFDEQFHLMDADGETPLKFQRYRITDSNGQIWEGISGANGLTRRVYTQTEAELSIEILKDERDEIV